MRSAVARVAAGPDLSKNLSYDETREVMDAILSGKADPVQATAYFIGLRMKRESDEEFKAILDATRDHTTYQSSKLKSVVAIAEPYNGFNRTIPGSLFSLPILAACGVNAYSHGAELAGPKFGVTHHLILKALGHNPQQSIDATNTQLENPDIGWGYCDQKVFCPSLHNLTELRTRMVKRPAMSTTESMLCPIAGSKETHLVTGYVHKPYRDTYTMLARHCQFTSFLLIKGTEGGVVPSFRAPAQVIQSFGEELIESEIDLAPLGMLRDYRAEDIPKETQSSSNPLIKWDPVQLANLCAERGVAALTGRADAVQDASIMGAALILWHLKFTTDLTSAVKMAKAKVSSGEALARLHAGSAS